MKTYMKDAGHWFLLLLLMDVVFVFVTWILCGKALRYMAVFLILFSAWICAAGIFFEYRRRKKEKDALLRFLEMPNESARQEFLQKFGEQGAIALFGSRLLELAAQLNEKTVELAAYREYMEAWVHEAKTPLSLSALVLGNHKEEMSPYVYARMHYIQLQLGEAVERILYYARLTADHADYKFTAFRLDECVLEVLEEYQLLMKERRLQVNRSLEPLTVVSDRKVVSFMLAQLISNAVKYADGSAGKLSLCISGEQDRVHFCIFNNGSGVPPEDAPFVFDKGFTGNHASRQKATGMGLYLVRKYAQNLCAQVRLNPQIPYESGFGIELVFTL